jgi:thymidylate kinase
VSRAAERPEPLLELYPELGDYAAGFVDAAPAYRAAAADVDGAPPLVFVAGEAGAPTFVRRPLSAPATAADGVAVVPLLADGAARARAEAAVAAVRAAGPGLRALRPVPVWVGWRDAGPPPPTTAMPRSWRGVLPGPDYPAALRDAWRELVRLLRPDRAFAFAAAEQLALAGFDVAAEIAVGRFSAPPPAPRRVRPAVFAIEGQDGSGKSTHLEALRTDLAARGYRVRAFKMYRHGVFHDTTTSLAVACRGGARLHQWRLERTAKLFDSVKYFATEVEPALDGLDVALFDRWTGTHFAAAAGRLGWDPLARELLSVYPAADRVWLLDAPAEVAVRRVAERPVRTVDEHAYMLARYRDGLLVRADREGWSVLDATRPFEENRARIRAEADAALRDRGLSEPRP